MVRLPIRVTVTAWSLKLVFFTVAASADTSLLFRQALEDLRGGRAESAEQKLAVVAKQEPSSADVHYYLGVARFRLHRLKEAQEALGQALRVAPSRADAWKTLGVVYAAQGNYQLAEAPLRKACEIDPQEEDACYYLGRNYYELNRFEAAIAAFEKALRRDDEKRWRIHNGLALALGALARPEEAEQQFRLAVSAYRYRGRPEEDPRIDFGVFLFRQGRGQEAISRLEQVKAASPGSSRVRFELGKALSSNGLLLEAARELEKAVELEPTHWEAHLLLGKVYYRLGRPRDGDRHTALGQNRGRQGRHNPIAIPPGQ